MAPVPDNVLPKLLQGFRRIHEEVRKLADDPTKELPYEEPYEEGVSLTSSDVATMKIAFDLNANRNFWEPPDHNRRCALKESFLNPVLQTLLDDTIQYKKELTDCHRPTISDARTPSSQYCSALKYLVMVCLFRNEDFLDSSGDGLFHDLPVCYLRSYIYMESHLLFGSPGHPHITIISLQPQRAKSQKALLCTEFWTLYYWAQKLARRALPTTKQLLPIRLVSLCGYEARVVSAVFSLAYPRSVVRKAGHSKDLSVGCQIHIAEYRDLSIRQNFQDLMEELVASPCGNVNV